MLYDRGKGVVCGAHAREQHIPRKRACHGSLWLQKCVRERERERKREREREREGQSDAL